MPLWDSADLLARCKRYAARPPLDAQMTDADWYALLSEAQHHWFGVFAAHVPHVLWSAPVRMTTPDGGQTYEIPGLTGYPLAIEIRESRTGRLLLPGAEWDWCADFTPEGARIRIPNGQSRSFGDGPYARYIEVPPEISDTVQPKLEPPYARILLVYHALAKWASIGGWQNPAYWEREEQKAAWGDPETGQLGIVPVLKEQWQQMGTDTMRARGQVPWWRVPELAR